jgi:hypothetical protein
MPSPLLAGACQKTTAAAGTRPNIACVELALISVDAASVADPIASSPAKCRKALAGTCSLSARITSDVANARPSANTHA